MSYGRLNINPTTHDAEDLLSENEALDTLLVHDLEPADLPPADAERDGAAHWRPETIRKALCEKGRRIGVSTDNCSYR